MKYRSIAEELLSIQVKLHHVRANQLMGNFARGELFVLNYLAAHGGRSYPKDLSKSMDVSSARVAAILNQMEKKGWINRSDDTIDSRQTVITLTNDGQRQIYVQKEQIIDAVAQMLESIGPEDANTLLRIERKIMTL